ncbi:universal stress protein [Pseudanabaena sp. PCC 6802]|uniref:universal stress protein n=1 Tax=Pseudanabaena sp. PCC 6802 TaxID=118173 RepID=UPI00036EFFBC|nr:universal stress protein [Pseudanabaena sp. PCC 6802]
MFQKILVAMDMSKDSKRVFDEAIALAKANKGSMVLLHVLSIDEEGCPNISKLYNPDPYQSGTGSEMVEQYQKQWEAFAKKGLDLLRSHSKAATAAGVHTECVQSPGIPGKTICNTACTWDADLIVMGRRGLSGLSETLMGSVSNYVLHHAPCAVLTVQSQVKMATSSHPSESSPWKAVT